jgi:hypothetical protein
MAKPPGLRTLAKAKTASKRPKTVTIKTVSNDAGSKTRLFALDANSASFGDDFLYAFKSNVRLARKKSKERRAAADGRKRPA